MEKKLILVNGTMGVGKSAVCGELLRLMTPGVWLDGDWCWHMEPFAATEENKAMVLGNITHLLRAFLQNSGYAYVIFCWVMQEEGIVRQVLGPLSDLRFLLYRYTLECPEKTLRQRLRRDIEAGLRSPGIIERSLARRGLYDGMKTLKIDTEGRSPKEIAVCIKDLADRREGEF